MNKNSRTQNSFINIITNFIAQLFMLLLTFFTRRVFVKSLGMDFLGISGLFTNILDLFALAELGIGSVIYFSMYKWIVEKNYTKLQELNTYYKKLYNRIALIILLIGLSILPFLKYIINFEEKSIAHIEIYYLIYLLNSVISYLFVYKTSVVYADQSGYKLKWIDIIIEVSKNFLQIFSLIFLKNYFLYLIIQLVCSITSNLIKSKLADKWYPFIREERELPREEKKELWSNIISMFCYKLGGVLINSTDNILISALINTTLVGIYSNYTMIYNKIYGIINLFFSSVVSSIGNLNVISEENRKYEMYNTLTFLSHFFFTIAIIGIWFIADDVVVAITASEKYILDKNVLIIGIINFYIMGMLMPNYIFRQTSDLFKIAKYSMLIGAFLNLLLSIIFGKVWGLFGIILGSIFSRLFTNVWYEPYILYKKFFKKNPMEYYIRETFRIAITIAIIIFVTPLIRIINFYNLYLNIAVKFIICLIIPTLILVLINWKSKELQYLLDKIKFIFKCYKNKLK